MWRNAHFLWSLQEKTKEKELRRRSRCLSCRPSFFCGCRWWDLPFKTKFFDNLKEIDQRFGQIWTIYLLIKLQLKLSPHYSMNLVHLVLLILVFSWTFLDCTHETRAVNIGSQERHARTNVFLGESPRQEEVIASQSMISWTHWEVLIINFNHLRNGGRDK